MPAEIPEILRSVSAQQLEIDNNSWLFSLFGDVVGNFLIFWQKWSILLRSSAQSLTGALRGPKANRQRRPLLRALRSFNRLEPSYMAEHIQSSSVHAIATAPVSRLER